jgi:hypothetical protein
LNQEGYLFAGSANGAVFIIPNARNQPDQRPATDRGEAIYGIAAAGGSVWVCGDEQVISTSSDGFATRREEHRDPLGGALHAIVVASPGKGFAVGDNGVMLKYDADGKWTRKPNVVTTRLNAVRFADASNGWIVGDYGTVLHTIDGGVNWQRVTGDWLPVASNVTTQPSVMHPSTQPAGIDRARLSSYRPMWMPAPWYFASVLGLLGLVTMGMRRPPQPVNAKLPDNYVPAAEQAASDKPLERGEPDPLQFGVVAAGLSRFLRNENTLPPLTLAITGVWGSGKSSLMNLLKSDLERFDVRPVWFNAWHHQHDERPLASLLEAIKQQGVPPFWSGAGMRFRASLLWQRSKRWRPVMLAAAIFFAWMLGYYMRNQHEFSRIVSGVTDTISSFLDFIQGKQAARTPPADGGITGDGTLAQVGFLAFLGTGLALGRSLFGALRAFGADPARLMQSVSDRARIQDLHAKADFRPRFVREFGDVTKALGERSMIIFIDDLDRCESPQVLEMLESVNFLVTSGDCFVVLGMDVKIVTPSVALQFRDLASEVAAEDEDPADDDLADFRRRAFARNYLDKLVQIEVSVPMTDPARSVRVIAPEKDEQKKDLRYYWRTGWTVGWRVLPLLLCGLAIYCAALYGARVEAPTREPSPRSQALAPVRPTSNPSSTTQAAETAPVVAVQSIFVATTQPTPHLVPPESPRNAFWIVAAPAGAIIAALLWIILTRPQATVPDSETFKNAVKLWHPALFGHGATPRSMKRFMNRVRFLAMKQQPGGEELTPRERLAKWFKEILGLTEPTTKVETSPVTPVDADLLVSWAGIERVLGKDRGFTTMTLERVCRELKLGRTGTKPLSLWLTEEKWSAMVACYENYRVLSQGASIH